MESERLADKEITLNTALAQRVQQELGENVYLCYQCIKCTSGCPVNEFFDWQPNQILRALQLGQEDIALQSQTPWLCAACQTCTTRCPQDIDIAEIMAFLTREALARGYKPSVPEVDVFNQAFMREVRLWGRSYELGLMAEMKIRNLRTHSIMEDMDLGVKVIAKNKMPFIPKSGRPPRKVKKKDIPANALGYYPGCSLHSTAAEYNHSAHAVCQALGITLVEPDGWVCCGSTPAYRHDPEAALRLPLENLRLIEQNGLQEVAMPCAACFNHHKVALHEIRHNEQQKAAMAEAMHYTYQDSVTVSSLSEAIYRRVGPKQIANKVKQSLAELRVVCYYGCLLTRPPEITEVKHPDNPTDLDELMQALGAKVLDWSYKTTCCGATHSLTRQDIVLKLSSDLIKHAQQTGADAIVVACPLCHTNLDARQFQMKLEQPTPVLFFTQLMAIALGLPEKVAALEKNLVDPRPLLKAKGIL